VPIGEQVSHHRKDVANLTMPSSPGTSKLTVLTATDAIATPLPQQGPVLITDVDSPDVARQLVTALTPQVAPDTIATLIRGATSLEIPLSELEHQDPPYSVYLAEPLLPALSALRELIAVVAQLRSPQGGCPWDLAQTAQTLIPYVIEEAYEVADAIQQGDPAAIAEELGDLLLQVVLQAQIASEQNQFSLAAVAQGISEKLIRRHPHVFGDVEVSSIEEVHQNWEQIKTSEQAEGQPHTLSHQLRCYARSLPPLMAGLKISHKAAAAGLEWEDITGVWSKFYEELAEFQESLLQTDPEHQRAELGDLLFTLINLARWSNLDPGEALRETNHRFIQRIQTMEAFTDQPLSAYTLEELEAHWQQAKIQLGQAQSPSIQGDADKLKAN